MKVPNLAIHLTDRSGTFEPNKESHTKPILASSVVDQLMGAEATLEAVGDEYRCDEKHFRSILDKIAADIGVDRSQIVDFELNVVDTQPAALIGLYKEFVSSPRIDNLASCLVALDSIIESPAGDNSEVNMIMFFDHEEIGS